MIRPQIVIGSVAPKGAEICVEIFLVRPNEMFIRNGKLPLLYESGVRYQREPVGRENWQTAIQLLRSRRGDCEDLAAYRAAERRVRGEKKARVLIVPNTAGGYHAVVECDGVIEDPSRRLGM